MTRHISLAAFALGALMVLWMGSAFVGANPLALTVIVIIGAVYVIGFVELMRFQQATATLGSALSTTPETISDLNAWLSKLHPSLQNGVRQRIEGEHVGLPAPVLTPYLVGLLVMLGLLGTFAGMVDTLKGAVTALEGTNELEAIRAGLAAPIEGLGMAFGTSVAGVAASAMLGFISTLSRRERLLASRQLDSKVCTVFRDFSLSYNRQQTFKAMQQQAQALPQVAETLTLLADQLGRMSEQLSTQLLTNQDNFHQTIKAAYSDLASSVDQSLRTSMTESGRLAGESIQPVVQEIMQGIQAEVQSTHQQLSATAQQQLATMDEHFSQTSEGLTQAWQAGLEAHEQTNATLVKQLGESLGGFSQQFEDSTATLLSNFDQASLQWQEQQQAGDQQRLEHWAKAFEEAQQSLQKTAGELSTHTETTAQHLLTEIGQLLASSETLVQARMDNEASWLAEYQQRMEQLTRTIKNELEALRQAEERRGDTAVARLGDLQTAVTEHLATLGNALEEPMARLIETASETPRAAAEVIEKLRGEITKNIERDNNLLEERRRIMEELNTLSGSLEQASNGQRAAVEKMVASSAEMLETVGERFTQQVGSEVGKLSDIADHFAGGATELSSLGEAFGLAVQLFTDTNSELMDKLGSVEAALQQSTTRSDEQLAYYVAQAREIIDHNMLSQQTFIEQLQQLSGKNALAAAEVA